MSENAAAVRYDADGRCLDCGGVGGCHSLTCPPMAAKYAETAATSFDDPTRRAEAPKTPEVRRGWGQPRHPEPMGDGAHHQERETGATTEGVRAEARHEKEDRVGGDPGNAPVAGSDAAASIECPCGAKVEKPCANPNCHVRTGRAPGGGPLRLCPDGTAASRWYVPLPNREPKTMGFARYTYVLGIFSGFAIFRIVEALT